MTRPRFPYAARLSAVRAAMAESHLDALVLSHPPNLFYLCGFSGTAGALVLDGHAAHLVVDFRYLTAARALATGHPDLAALQVVLAESSEDDALAAMIKGAGWTRVGIEAASMPVLRFNRLSAALAGGAPTPLAPERSGPALVPTEGLVERCRVVKDAAEIAVLRAAAAMLSAVAREILPAIVRAGRREAEIGADLDGALRRAGFSRPAFETIVASGPNGALPHARPSTRMLEPGDPVVLDFGGIYDGYCVDLTRTVQLAPSTPEFRRLFAAVVDAHDHAIRAVRPGVATADIDYAARHTLEVHGLGAVFGHGTGHGLGVEVHEEPRIARADARPPVTVLPGMVFTIEPGVYVPGIGGVRIEDDVLVVADGCEVLTQVPIQL
ncbi:MAG TPA: Xaa-Pro peptidase family protein [Vicinamibacterales bacterium]|jgi:Xaa-Pro aminopeptidase|nr:Xaa-Pro peptidase family protein [Vicinamibacterales bacterium]